MTTAPPCPLASFKPETAAPVRSPRTSIVLAELARQRRLERSNRRLKRQQRRQAWARVTAWLCALGRWPLEALRTRLAAGLPLPEPVPLADALRPFCALGSAQGGDDLSTSHGVRKNFGSLTANQKDKHG